MRLTFGRRLASAAGLAFIGGGVPAALWLLAGWPLPDELPSPSQVAEAVQDGWTPSAGFIVGVLAVTLWLLWAYLMTWVAREARRSWRTRAGQVLAAPLVRPDVRVRAMQGLAGWLVGGIIAAGPLGTAAAFAHPIPVRLPQVLMASGIMAPTVEMSAPVVSPGEARPTHPRYVVRPWADTRDCLWVIAERYLADPFRWTEIYDLNRHRVQADGRHLGGDPHRWVYPGWELLLPQDASGDELQWAGAAGVPGPSPPAAVTQTPPAGGGRVPEPPEPRTTLPLAVPTSQVMAAPSPSPATTTTATAVGGQAPATANPKPVASPVPAAVKTILPPVLAGAVLLELARRTLVQHRHRRRGRDVNPPPDDARATEWLLRSIPGTEAAEWVDLTVRYLRRSLTDSGLSHAPSIVCVRAGALGVEIVMDAPSSDAAPGFQASEEGRLWRLDPAFDLDDIRRLASGTGPLVPALLTIGSTEEGSVLINLECAGSLSVEGDPERVRTFLRSAALEMASAPWARELPVSLVGGDERLGDGNPRVEVHGDPSALLRHATKAAEETEAGLEADRTLHQHRLADESDDWLPMVIVVEPPANGDLAELVAVAQPKRSGVVVVAPGPIPGAGWRLHIETDGSALLHPLGLTVRSELDPETLDGAATLLAARADIEDIAPVVELVHAVENEGTAVEADEDSLGDPPVGVYVRFLRRLPIVECRGRPDVPPRTKLAELIHYLASHDNAVSRARLRAALWPMRDDDPFDERSLNTFSTLISRARRALGHDADGNLILPNSRNHYYQLGKSGWISDWREFRGLVRRAETTPLGESIELLASALDLVEEGMPLSDVPETGYGWALTDLQDVLIREVVDAAEMLAERALAGADPKRVELAARKGLAVSPCREPLWRARMQVAADVGDRDALTRAYEGARRAARSVDALGEPESDTTRLYRTLRKALTNLSEAEPASIG